MFRLDLVSIALAISLGLQPIPVAASDGGATPTSGPAVSGPDDTSGQPVSTASTSSHVVRGVLFFSPACPHCVDVLEHHLPDIFQRFGGTPHGASGGPFAEPDGAFQLLGNGTIQLLLVDVSVDAGTRIFLADSARLGLPDAGVPRIDIADDFLVGSLDIPERLPSIIESGLEASGIDWPEVPGLAEILASSPGGDLAGVPREEGTSRLATLPACVESRLEDLTGLGRAAPSLTAVASLGAALIRALMECMGLPMVLADQARGVGLEDGRDDVAAKLGGPGASGTFTEEYGPDAGRVWDDCWFYLKVGGSRLVVCFEGDETRLLVGAWR